MGGIATAAAATAALKRPELPISFIRREARCPTPYLTQPSTVTSENYIARKRRNQNGRRTLVNYLLLADKIYL